MAEILRLKTPEPTERQEIEELVRAAQRACCVQTACEYVYFMEKLRLAVEKYTGESWINWKT